MQAMLRQLVVAGANGNKSAARQYMTYLNNAARTVEARKKLLFERLGAYLKAVDEGRRSSQSPSPW